MARRSNTQMALRVGGVSSHCLVGQGRVIRTRSPRSIGFTTSCVPPLPPRPGLKPPLDHLGRRHSLRQRVARRCNGETRLLHLVKQLRGARDVGRDAACRWRPTTTPS